MRAKKTKYTLRADGRIVLTKTIDGKRVSFYGQTDREVEQKYANYLKAKPQKCTIKVRKFEQVADAWWEIKEPELSPNSVTPYKSQYLELSAEFKNKPVDEITPGDIVSYLRRLAAQGYSQKSIYNKKGILKSILDEALIAGEIKSNPCVNLPFIKGKPQVKRLPASEDDIKRIEAHKNDSNIARMFYFCLYTGCRRSEAEALQQKHIDRENKTAHICQAVAYLNANPIIKTTKTESSIRDVDLYSNVLEILPNYKDPNKFVFFPQGLPRERKFQELIDKFRKENGIQCTMHQLRHSYATMLHSAGVDAKDAQQRLGHSSVIITQDIYTDIESKHRKRVADKIEEYVQKERLLSNVLSEPATD